VVVFLPLFSEYFVKDKKKAWQFTNSCLNIFLILLILISLIFFIFTPVLIELIVPGFNLEQKNLTIFLTRLMFLSPIFFGLASIFSGILQYFNRFLIYGLAPILYNLGIIFGIIFLVPYFKILGVVLGVVLGALGYFLVQIPSAISCGFRYQPIFNFQDPALKKIFLLMIPRVFGLAAQQINLIVITSIASTLVVGSIAVFNLANNLQSFLIGIIGISFAIASFPVLSRAWAQAQKKEFIEKFSFIFRQILYLIIPLSLLMFILRGQIVRIILGTGQFDWLATRLVAASLGLFCLGILANALIPLIFRAFFALQNTKTPTLIAIGTVILNIILSFSLTWLLTFPNTFKSFLIDILKLQGIGNIAVLGLPLAFSMASLFQFILLMFFLYKEIGDLKFKEIFQSFSKIFLASILMVFSVYFVLHQLALLVDMKTFLGVLTQTILAAFFGIFIYILATSFLKSPEIETIKSSILKQFRL